MEKHLVGSCKGSTRLETIHSIRGDHGIRLGWWDCKRSLLYLSVDFVLFNILGLTTNISISYGFCFRGKKFMQHVNRLTLKVREGSLRLEHGATSGISRLLLLVELIEPQIIPGKLFSIKIRSLRDLITLTSCIWICPTLNLFCLEHLMRIF